MSKDDKRPSDLDGSRVLVLGSGNSAGDIAIEAARAGFETWIAIRRGRHIFPETLFGVPIDQIERWYLSLPLQRVIAKALLRIAVAPMSATGCPSPSMTSSIATWRSTRSSSTACGAGN